MVDAIWSSDVVWSLEVRVRHLTNPKRAGRVWSHGIGWCGRQGESKRGRSVWLKFSVSGCSLLGDGKGPSSIDNT